MEKLVAKILKSAGNERRLMILGFLYPNKEMTVSEISHRMRLSIKSVSRHLGKLENVGLIKKRQTSRWVFYSLNFDKKKPYNRCILDIVKKIQAR
ncbi:MAG: metalloregulator ArsR/SmtB family transcription factor [Elusimicrobiota bacterium]|nr:metalloregulator ArsR/SmtB family transcription factor [Elusimicrobiota bacterium]